MSYLRMINGKLFDFQNPHRAEFTIEDVATVLGRIQRFGNHGGKRYSDAEHMYHASYMYTADPKGALMHDSPEWVTGDVITPFKECLSDFREVDDRILYDLQHRFNFQKPEPYSFKAVDTLLFHLEQYHLFPDTKFPYSMSWLRTLPKLRFWTPKTATEKFLERYYELSNL